MVSMCFRFDTKNDGNSKDISIQIKLEYIVKVDGILSY